ncbi:SWI/SNF chromatin-remodeling complex subunit [Steccherinum ochraceum]|uniref:SWI/SNF chromatin-remodeling complex subunit n=1 Tax=Steccherinum ochraceum TaxID=92696 RepID=A0A4R0RZH3_9APHY|nr:SWI/SNF chromatin-remodeling complex subunit [Steccherinum ochraceum]
MKLPGMNVGMPPTPGGMQQQQQGQQGGLGGGGNQTLMGGAGGGMMGPPVFPRSGSQGPGPGSNPMDPTQQQQQQQMNNMMSMGMNLPGMNVGVGMGNMGMGMNMNIPGVSRQPSGGALSVNTNVPQSASAPGALGSAGGMPTTPHQLQQGGGGGQMFPTPAQALMATAGTPTSASSPAHLGGGGGDGTMPGVPGTPQIARQGSIPPSSATTASSVGMGMGGMGPQGLNALERKMNAANANVVGMHVPPRVPTADGTQPTLPNGTATSASANAASSGGSGAPAPTSTPAATATIPTGPPTIVPILPPLPPGVALNPKTTRITVVPLIDSTTLVPPLSPEDVSHVKEWMAKDKAYEAAYRKMKENMVEEVRDSVLKGRGWWEKGGGAEREMVSGVQEREGRRRVPEKFGVTGFKTGKEDGRRRKAGRREGFKLPRLAEQDALVSEQLVPIRLELDVEHHKMRDTFVWNLNDPIITPEIFAQSIIDDYALSPNYHTIITKAIQDQLSDYKAHSTTFGGEADGVVPVVVDVDAEADETVVKGVIEEEEEVWWDGWRKEVRSGKIGKMTTSGSAAKTVNGRKRRKVVKDEVVEGEAEDVLMGPPAVPATTVDVPVRADEIEEDESKMQEEMRILIKLDIIVGSAKLEDQFEWDLDNNDPSPERFAEVYANELGLAGEFKTAIAHCIREQVQIFQKSLFLVGHPSDGSILQDDDLRMSLLPSLSTGARSMDQVGAFTPLLHYLSESEIERNEREREKELNRRRRKTTRGRRGVILPDREPPKTLRTPAIGFPEIDAATLALVNAAAAPTSRRAAAAAASVNIANIIASDNGTMVIPAAAPAAPLVPTAIAAPKEKKPKGLFKAPPVPTHVLRPRATVKAPTPSTAADASTLMPPIEGDTPAPTSNANPENRGARVVLTSKRVRELEREAKEKEYADGQHANYIDGVWHCSNCGCPENIAIGRRKGPLGDKSQCGTCGKFWHRHRRPRPVVYNSSLAFHQGLRDQEEQAKMAASRKKRPHAAQVDPPSSKAPTVEPETPKPKSEVWVEINSKNSGQNGTEDPERAPSPASSTSSASEPPLAQRVKANGINHSKSAPPAPQDPEEASSTTSSQQRAADEPSRASTSSAPPITRHATSASAAPQWLKDAMAAMQAKYPDDRFEIILKPVPTSPTPEWRIKCKDCPGKLYTPGPGESLQNYEVHLKNRQHRHKVTQRISGGGAS